MHDNLADAQILVIKIGTTSLTHENGTVDLHKMDQMARVLTDLENEGRRIILVSSGAIGCGMHRLRMETRPSTLEEKQMAAQPKQPSVFPRPLRKNRWLLRLGRDSLWNCITALSTAITRTSRRFC